jgi:DNA-binding response OmpR family regulator
MSRLLIVEDEPNLAQGLKFNLEIEGYHTDVCETAEDALPRFGEYDLMILDIMLPKMSGIELLTEIRKQDYKYPVLILSARTAEEDILEGLSAGADDYITKPFSLPELILRIKRILQRQSWYSKTTKRTVRYTFGHYWIDFDAFKACTNSGEVELTHYECYIMKYLIENKHRTVSREELLEKIWGYDNPPETRSVDNFIARLRKHFEADRKNPKYLKSIRGVGYRFLDY